MPLDAKHESRCPRHGDSLDLAVRRLCFYDQSFAKPIDALAVERIDLCPGSAGYPFQQAAFAKLDWMTRTVADFKIWMIRLPVVQPPWLFMYTLKKRAAESDIEFLDTPAKGEHRDGILDGMTDERQGTGIPLRV
jgi:hypothetical protein